MFCLTTLLPYGVAAAQTAGQQSEADQSTPPQYEDTIEVVGATPIHGLGIDRNKIPSNIQTVTADALERTGGSSIGEQMNLEIPSVHVNEATTNPFQPDLQFRGFVGSPLLGLPQGLAVYQNGVRLNEPFGDTVNWDLLASNAIASINLMPGSNPLFGLNALGGAVSIQTKTGFSHPGHAVSVSGGSFGRRRVDAASGAHTDRVSYFVAGSALSEEGWRDFSPSRIGQLFGDVEWRRASTTMNATVNAGDNRLVGNGAAPIELLEQDRSAIFTYPDETKTRMALLTFRARHNAGPAVSLDGMFFYRRASIRTFNGDDSDYGTCEAEGFEAFLCSDDGQGGPVEDQFDELIPVDEDDELDGTNNTSKTVTNGWGGAFQATVVKPLSDRPNHFVAGATFDGGRSNYEADTEIARLTDERGTIGTGLFDQEAVVRLRTRVRHAGLYAADFFTVAPKLTLMGAARFNHSGVTLRDQAGTALDGDHSFSRLNPAAGLTYDLPREATTVRQLQHVVSRTGTIGAELCRPGRSLPASECVCGRSSAGSGRRTRTWEGGIRGRRQGIGWNASIFRTANSNDIMFISSGPLTNTGHFENVGDTLRQGIELGASGAVNAVRWGAAYSYLRAQFETPLTLSSPNHPDAEDGEIDVEAGSRIPGVPQHNLKAHLSATIKRLTLGGSFLTASNQYLRGDEANLLPAIDGFTVVNLTANYAIRNHFRLTGRVTNLFGSEFSTFGLLGEADEVLGDDYQDPRFLSPGAPRAAWVGVEFSFR